VALVPCLIASVEQVVEERQVLRVDGLCVDEQSGLERLKLKGLALELLRVGADDVLHNLQDTVEDAGVHVHLGQLAAPGEQADLLAQALEQVLVELLVRSLAQRTLQQLVKCLSK